MGVLQSVIGATLPLVPRPLVGRIARRYVAGDRVDTALGVVAGLAEEGFEATLSLLGEEVTDPAAAEEATQEYIAVASALAQRTYRAGLSVKPTLLGLRINEVICRENLERVVLRARERGCFVRLDMEDRSCTDPTLQFYREVQARHDNVGVVLQAYMRRTLRDIAELPENANVRLCKGIYIEPRKVSWQGYETVRLNFLAALERLFARGAYVAVATHDEYLVCGARALIERLSVPKNRYEFQTLLGVDPELRRVLRDEGHKVRVYVPYGQDWYRYSVRRLRENPRIAIYVLRALLGRE